MQNKNYATKMQRFLIFVIDFMIIQGLTMLSAFIFRKIIHFDLNTMETVYDALLEEIKEYTKAIANNEPTDTAQMIAYFKEYLKYFGLNTLINCSFSLIYIVLYLVILPIYWHHQTLGRMMFKAKVVKKDGSPAEPKQFILREVVGTFLMYIVLGGSGIFLVTFILLLCKGRTLVDYIGKTDLVSTVITEDKTEIIDDLNQDEYVEARFKELPSEEDSTEENTDSDDEYRII